MTKHSAKPLFEGPNWSFDLLKGIYDAVQEVAIGEIGLDVYPNQIEVITAEQMLDAYASIGMPLMYRHWSFGKHFAREEMMYRRGVRPLAYELVINSNPCVCYVMEDNSMTMQTLVLAHAAFGHNHFFKNNTLFQQWTDASFILDYLAFAKSFVARCEQRFGADAVETVLDGAHALMRNGISRYARRISPRPGREQQREIERREYEEVSYDDLWRTVPGQPSAAAQSAQRDKADRRSEDRRRLNLPEENLLYFLEKHAPKLDDWQRELLRIVRNLAQYFYPQRQTKMMNEGCATFVHYEIMNRLYGKGLLTEGAMLEFLDMHAAVVFQPGFDDRRFGGVNPYTLGFAMMRDLKRICEEPTAEDRDWFPDIAGNGDAFGTLKAAWADYRDESFILQYLSPKVIRDLRLFAISDEAEQPQMRVEAIHDERGYRAVRRMLARQYDVAYQDPDIQVTDADLKGSRQLVLTHTVRDGVLLDKDDCDFTLQHLAQLWGYRVKLIETDTATGRILKEHNGLPIP